MPSRERGLPSVAVEREGELLLFDCGEGTQRQLVSSRLSRFQPDVIFITHSHADHLLGLFGLLMSMSLHDRRENVKLVAPADVEELLSLVMKKLGTQLSFGVEFFSARPGVVHRGKGYVVRASRAFHHGEAYSYRLDEDERPGRFYPEKAIALGIPKGPLWQKLQHGRSVIFKGKRIRPEQVTGPKRPGRSFGYSGDTRPRKELARFFGGVDVLFFDSTYTSEYSDVAKRYGHSTAEEAGMLAKRAKAGILVLYHISHRVSDEQKLLDEAKRYHERVIVAKDFLQVDVPLHDQPFCQPYS